jgi:hypothetical protein
MSDPQRMAAMIRDVLNDRLENSTQEPLALEAATLRAFLFSTLDTLDHICGHIERDEIRDKEQLLTTLHHLSQTITIKIANLDDVRLELERTAAHSDDT